MLKVFLDSYIFQGCSHYSLSPHSNETPGKVCIYTLSFGGKTTFVYAFTIDLIWRDTQRLCLPLSAHSCETLEYVFRVLLCLKPHPHSQYLIIVFFLLCSSPELLATAVDLRSSTDIIIRNTESFYLNKLNNLFLSCHWDVQQLLILERL